MDQQLATNKKPAANQRRIRFNFRNSTAGQSHERHRSLIDMLRSPIIRGVYPDWFAQRIWEDDGGGQAQLG